MAVGAGFYFLSMARNNAWANHRLLRACNQLGPADFAAKRTSFFPSIMATLNHILVVDWFYIDGLEGGTLGPAAWANEVPHPDFTSYKVAQAAVDQRLISFCDALDEVALALPVRLHRGSHVQVDRVDRILLHLFEHQVHHRGQAHAMLAGTNIAPPQLDEFFCASDARFRGEDFAELGWREDEVWRGLELK
ncbi:MAG: damage-inducible protein DinB [Rhodospirillaceae bacterium]|nr:damage-inducible protein DinB [Rhodospirillaceae bacterium]